MVDIFFSLNICYNIKITLEFKLEYTLNSVAIAIL